VLPCRSALTLHLLLQELMQRRTLPLVLLALQILEQHLPGCLQQAHCLC
jgi:hypothetical protein